MIKPVDYVIESDERRERRAQWLDLVKLVIKCATVCVVVASAIWSLQIWTTNEYRTNELSYKLVELGKKNCKVVPQSRTGEI